jgi:diguanylate cyclase (GGDEF)-like protein
VGTRRAASGRRRWVLVACSVLVAGLSVSLIGAALWRSSARTHNREAFDTSASNVTGTLKTLLRRDADFVGTLRAVLTLQAPVGTTRFEEWFDELQGRQRLAGGVGVSVVERVPSSALATFQARRDADPAFATLVDGDVERVHAAGRKSYCLLSAGALIGGGFSRDLGHVLQGDWCLRSSEVGASQALLLQAQTDTGQLLVLPVAVQGVHTIIFQTAFYRRGAKLTTVTQRRVALVGWVISTFDVAAIVHAALGASHHLSVSLYHSNPDRRGELIDREGDTSAGGSLSYSRTLQIDGRWSVAVSGAPSTGTLSADGQGLLVLIVGLVVSALLFALILVLARSREHALGMVRRRTGELRHQALHDALTGLPNRVLALDRAEQMLATDERKHVAALYVDLDGFKQVNDTFGHAAGDELLRMVAGRLSTVVRAGDTAARLGGDEFVVLLAGIGPDSAPARVAERLLEVLARPYDLGATVGRQLSVTASVGLAEGPRDSADELLRDADLALYEAKAAGRNRCERFRSGMQSACEQRLTLEMDLAEAIDRRELFLVYQPTFDLRSERMTGVEALIRWRHPRLGVVSPNDFIPMAERSGLIVPIGRWVLEEASRQAAAWRRCGHHIGVSVNVSARQLDGDGLIEDVRHALTRSGLEPASLTLEVTETALMRDPDAAAERLATLRVLGVRIAIDDFGTGYSSLAYLRRFPADVLKIDRSFVEGVATSTEAAALVHTLVQLGQSLGLETLAEGIEHRAQLQVLLREHCDVGQGFLFSRPLEPEAVAELLDYREPDELMAFDRLLVV